MRARAPRGADLGRPLHDDGHRRDRAAPQAARAGSPHVLIRMVTTKLEKLAATAHHPFREAVEWMGQFRRLRHAIGRTLSEPEVDGSKLGCVSAKPAARALACEAPSALSANLVAAFSCRGLLSAATWSARRAATSTSGLLSLI